MKKLFIAMIVFALVQCKQKTHDGKQNQMHLDSLPDKSVIKVLPNERLRPSEYVTDLKELRIIMGHDLNASTKIESKEIRYVKLGEALRPEEK